MNCLKPSKMFAIFMLALIAAVVQVSGLLCHSCSDRDFDGENGMGLCYNRPELSTSINCSGSDNYCRTSMTFQDGMPVSITRNCVEGQSDHDSSTNFMPLANKCETTLNSYNPIDTTTCFYHCNSSDDCNTVSLSTLRRCGYECGRSLGRGYCNYISGNCECNYPWTGANCSTRHSTTTSFYRRKCVQCNSETDRNCETKKDGAYCASSDFFCSSTQTSIFDEEGTVLRTVLIRGCTSSNIAVDECKFTDIYSDDGIRRQGYNEYTCYSTCDTDNCNTNIPNGRIDGDEERLFKCYQCFSSSGNCLRNLEFCPSGTTHCQSTVSYMISDKMDARYKADNPGAYKFVNVHRGCATAPVVAQCTESTIGDLSFKSVTCQETCSDDGCNDGWPARPKCIQCTGGYNSACLKSPAMASKCNHPYEKYCVIKDNGLEQGTRATVEGYPRYIERGCSYIDIGTNCQTTTLRDKEIQSCNYSCTTDGCNVGSGSASYHRIGRLALFFSILFVSNISGFGSTL